MSIRLSGKNLLLFSLSCYSLVPLLAQEPVFSDVAAVLDIQHTYQSPLSGGGVSFCDFDGDGWDDITLATAENQYIQFYRNTGEGFEQKPFAIFIETQEEAKQVLWVDFDNDGDKDFYVATYGGDNRLYRNDGLPYFTEITSEAGLPTNTIRTFGAAFGDYNRDGWLDLYYGVRVPNTPAENRHYLFQNNGDGTFIDVSEASLTLDQGSLPFCSAFLDYNNDRWPDIYTANDRVMISNTLFENNHDGTFTDVSEASMAGLYMDAMCVNVADVNQDGWQDIYVTNIPAGSAFLVNDAPQTDEAVTFSELAEEAGISFMGGMAWGSNFFDADNDGDLDLYLSGEYVGSNVLSSAYYRNEGNLQFSQPEAGFLGDTVKSFNNAIGDLNQDGQLDILVINQSPYPSQIWQNSGTDHHWIKINLEGILSNRDAIGSRVEAYYNDQYQMRYTHCGIAFLGQNSDNVHFGLGTNTQVDSLVITWPTGHQDRLYELSADTTLFILEGSSTNGMISVDPDVQLLTLSSNYNIEEADIQLVISPNPTSTQLQFKTELNQGNWAIFNTSGRLMQQGRFQGRNQQIALPEWPSGHYSLVLWSLETGRQQRVVASFIKL